MPSFDISRDRCRLAESHISVLGHLADDEQVPEELTEALEELREVGLVTEDDRPSALLDDLINTLGNPVVVIQVEITGPLGMTDHGIVVGRDVILAHESWIGDEESEYVKLVPALLVPALARMVNLRELEPASGTGITTVDTSMGALDAAFTALAELPLDDIDTSSDVARQAIAAAGGPAEPHLALFADMVVGLRASWRVTAAWRSEREGQAGMEVRGIAVWDCGPHGYWHRELPEEPVLEGEVTAESPLRLARITPKELWEKLTDLLPDQEDLAPGM
ncbi:hypothetical protein [Streptomyces sp. NPDC018031]|uniref:hypothetical protein n=1 Tax=Streptomyces sp. NPDC018031 TaxID=3365033 RepID=UPI0037B077FF